jgi:hypothetical protein
MKRRRSLQDYAAKELEHEIKRRMDRPSFRLMEVISDGGDLRFEVTLPANVDPQERTVWVRIDSRGYRFEDSEGER